MKKSIFAVLAVTAMGASHAQTADTSSVSLYGVIDEGYLSKQTNENASVGNVSAQENTSTSGLKPSNTSATYIGIRTKENLGNGLDAKATIEFGFTDPHGENAEGKSHVAIRQAYVGLYSNGFGNLTIGRLHNKTHDFLASDGLGSAVLPGTIFSNPYRLKDLDRSNAIRYSYGNEIVTGYISYGQENKKETATISIDGQNAKGVNTYSNHFYELAVQGKYQNAFGKVAFLKNHANQSITIDATDGNSAYSGGSNDSLTGQSFLVNLGYDFGIIKPSYTYLQNKTAGEYHGTKELKQTFHQLGFTAPVTSVINLYGSYYIKDASGVSGSNYALSTKNGNGWQIGTTYHFSKRTNLYAAYGQESIDYKYTKEGFYDINGKIDNKAYTIGLKHTF